MSGEPDEKEEELQGRNRVAWNRCMASKLSEKLRAMLIQVGRYSAPELTPFSEEELQALQLDFAKRSRSSSCTATNIADLISGDMDFSKTEIGYFNASNFIFPKWAKFNGTTFAKTANFSGAIFCERADFGGATFSAQVDFRGAAFSAAAVSKETAVSDFSYMADFQDATFSDEAWFEGATFAGVAYFWEVNFDLQRAYFGSAIFSADANFQGAIFSGGAEFKGCRFCKLAEFERTTFSDEADFSGATFAEAAYFVGATFPGKTDKIGTGIADFSRATFSEEANFEGTTFSGRAFFIETIYEASVSFLNAKMESETLFTSAAFVSEPPQFFGAKLHEGTVWRGATWPDPPNDAASAGRFADAYERLKLEMDRLKKHEDELDFFARELECRGVLLGYWREISKLRIFGYTLLSVPLRVPKVTIKGRCYTLFRRRVVLLPSFSTPALTVRLYCPGGGLPIALYGVLCDYGRSYVRPVLFLVLTIATGALPFWPRFGAGRALGVSFANTFAVLGIRKLETLEADRK